MPTKPQTSRVRCGLFTPSDLYAAPQDVGPWHAACRPADAILAALRGGLCKILHPNFREFFFHALG